MSLNKKFILTALLKNISDALFRRRSRSIVLAQVNNPIAGLSPTPAEGLSLINELDDAYSLRDTLNRQQLQNTEAIKILKKQVNDMIVDDWMPDVQKYCNGDVALAKLYNFGIKGEYDAESESTVSVKNSYPTIVNTISNLHLQVTIELQNNLSKEINLPADAKGIDVYEFVGENLPEGNYKKIMHYLGRAKKGKYTAYFDSDAAGKWVWLLAAYVPKNEAKVNGLCSTVKVMVI